jgi:hypothetical protein
MKFHDYNATLDLSLVTDDDGSGWRYVPGTGARTLDVVPLHVLRQGHYVANAIAQGLVIVGSRIKMVPGDWAVLGPESEFHRKLGGMT